MVQDKTRRRKRKAKCSKTHNNKGQQSSHRKDRGLIWGFFFCLFCFPLLSYEEDFVVCRSSKAGKKDMYLCIDKVVTHTAVPRHQL